MKMKLRWPPAVMDVMAYPLYLPEPLYGLILRCETECVAECCGIDAFDVSVSNIRAFVAESGIESLVKAAPQLEGLAVLFDAASEADGCFSNSLLNYGGSAKSWAELLSKWRAEVQIVLTEMTDRP